MVFIGYGSGLFSLDTDRSVFHGYNFFISPGLFARFDNTKKYQQGVEKNRTVYSSSVELSVPVCRVAPTEIY
jgi:hypothetical protein